MVQKSWQEQEAPPKRSRTSPGMKSMKMRGASRSANRAANLKDSPYRPGRSLDFAQVEEPIM